MNLGYEIWALWQIQIGFSCKREVKDAFFFALAILCRGLAHGQIIPELWEDSKRMQDIGGNMLLREWDSVSYKIWVGKNGF